MLAAREMRPVRHFWHMRIDLVRPIEAGPAPEGIEIHALEPGDDLEGVHGVLAEAFADDWGYHPVPFDRWVADQVASPSHDVTLWLLRRSFAAFAGRGLGRVMLNVDAEKPTGATALCERVGLRVVKCWDLWERER